MTRVNNSLNCIQSDAIAAAVLAESCHIVLETSPPDYVQKISRYLGSSVGQSKRDEASNAPAEAESDSGDSLFLTQKPVPEAERSRRRRPYSSRSKHISPRYLEERDEDDDSSSASSDGEPTTYKERRRSRRTYPLPKYSFPFLREQNLQFRRNLLPECIKNLHNYTMGGFFKCVRELRQHCERGKDLKSSLPTVDEDGKDISPLSEEDKEKSEDEDIKVVARKRFVFSSKAKSQHTWFDQPKQPRQTTASDARKETAGGRHKMQVKPSILKVTPLSSDSDSSDNGESSRSVLVQRKSNNATRQRNKVLATTVTRKPKKGFTCDKNVFILQKASDEGLCKNNDAAVCKPQKLQRSSRQPTGTGRAAFTPVVTQVGKISGSQRVICSPPDIQAKKRKEKEKEVPECLRAATSINVEVEETPSLFEDHIAELPAGQTSDQPGVHGQNGLEDSPCGGHILRLEEGDIPDAKQKKKKRKKKEKEEPEGLRAATSINVEVEETPSLFEDHRAEPPAGQTSDQLGIHGQNGLEDSPHGSDILRLEEGDIHDAKQKKKKRKKKEKEEPEGLRAATSINVEVEETPSLFEDHRAEPPAGQTSDQLGVHGQNGLEDSPHGSDILRLEEGDIHDAKQKKKKRKKKEKEEPEGLRGPISSNMEVEETPSLFEDHRAEPPGGQTSDQLGVHGQNGLEDSPHGSDILRLEEGDIPEAKQKKKKGKKNKSAAENVGQEVDGNLKSDVIAEDSGFSVSCNVEDGGKKKKKRRSTTDVEQLQFDTVSEPPNDDAVIQKKKKKKRKKEENRTLDLTAVSAENLEESRNGLGNVAASQGTESKRKKHKKKSSSYDASGDEDGLDDSVTMAKGSGMSLKKKKKKWKTLFEVFNVFHGPEENETVEIVDQRTKEGPEDQNAEPVTKKKKKKKKKKEKETERTSSFLAADAEEHDAQTRVEQNSPSQSHIWGAEKLCVSAGDLEELNDSVTKPKKKRKMSIAQDSVEKDHKQDFEEGNESQTGMKRKWKRTGSESESVTPMERLESAADVGLSPTDEAVALKKKKKCKGRTMNMVEHASASSETPGNQVLNEMRDKKKKKKMKSTDTVSLDCNSLTESAESEPRKKKKKQKKERNEQSSVPIIIISSPIIPETSLSKCEMSPSGNVMKNKHRKVKRRLLNPNKDFLSDW